MPSVQFAVTEGAAPTSATTQDFTVAGFGQPKAAMFFLSHATALDTVTDHCHIGFGWTDGTNSMSIGGKAQDNVGTSNTSRSQQQGEVLHALSMTADSVDGAATFDSWLTDGVRIDWTGNPPANAHRIVCVLINGDDVTAKVDVTKIAASTDITHGVGAIPDLMFFGATTGAEDGVSTSMSTSFGVYQYDGSRKQYNTCAYDMDGQATTKGSNILNNGKVISSLSDSGISREWAVTAESTTTVTLTRSGDAFGGDPIWLALSFGSSGIKTDMGSFDVPTSTGTQNYNNADSFQPQFILFGASDNQTESSVSVSANPSFSIGVVDDTNEYCIGAATDDNQTTSDTVSVTANKALYTLDPPGTNQTGDIGTIHTGSGAITSSGVTVDWTTANYSTARKGFWLQVEAAAAGGGQPIVKRFGGIPGMAINKGIW